MRLIKFIVKEDNKDLGNYVYFRHIFIKVI